MFILHLNNEPQHGLQNQLKRARILIPVQQNNPSHAQTLTNPPPTPAVAHFIINDLWLGVRTVTASVKTVVHSKKKLTSYNTDQRHIKTTRASVSYQLNLVSFDNFHNCICLTHLLHPLLLSLGQCSFFFSPRHQKHTRLSLWHCRPCPMRLTSAAPIPSFFYLRSPPNMSELSPIWTFSLFSPCTNCPHPPFPPPFLSSLCSCPPPSLCVNVL